MTHDAGSSMPALVSVVREKLRELHKKDKLSEETVRAALDGSLVSQYVATHAARALRELGHRADAALNRPPKPRGGRFSLWENDLDLLLQVREQFNKMSRADFAAWLDKQIEDRRKRAAAAPSARSAEAA